MGGGCLEEREREREIKNKKGIYIYIYIYDVIKEYCLDVEYIVKE